LELWAGCVAGALDKDEYLQIIRDAGFTNISIDKEKRYTLAEVVSLALESITLTATK
jgi:hypothetical protein